MCIFEFVLALLQILQLFLLLKLRRLPPAAHYNPWFSPSVSDTWYTAVFRNAKKAGKRGEGVWKSCSAEYLRSASWPMKGCLLGFQQNEDYSVMWYLIEDARRKRRPYYEPYVIEIKAAPSSFKRTYFSGSLDLCLWQKEFGIGHRTLVQCGSIR